MGLNAYGILESSNITKPETLEPGDEQTQISQKGI